MADEELTCGVSLTENERAIRERFVKEYLVDYDSFGAALRTGYAEAYARSLSAQFMQEPYVRQLIAEGEANLGVMTEKEKHQAKVVAGLYRIAGSRTSSASAQVAAYGRIATLLGLDAPTKTVQEVTVKEGGPDLSHLSVMDLETMKKMIYAPKAAPAANAAQ